MITRRQLVIVAGAWPVARSSFAQRGKIWRIGYLDPRTPATSVEYYRGFVQGMNELGYIEGKNLVIERQFADGRQERMRALAAEFARAKVDVIITDSSPAVRAALEATRTIPIVAAAIPDPVFLGFAKSLAHPGGNVTGLSNLSEEIIAKRLEMLVAAVPAAKRIAFLFNSLNEQHVSTVKAAAKQAGRSVILARAGTLSEIDSAFAHVLREKAEGLIINQDGFLSSQADRIAGLALRHRLPSIGGRRQIAEAGSMLSYGVDYVDMFRRAATYVDKIFKGTRAADLPVEQATKFELIVNVKTAKALGITLPQSILVRADRVIE